MTSNEARGILDTATKLMNLSIQELDTGNFGRALELNEEASNALLTLQLKCGDATIFNCIQRLQHELDDWQEKVTRLWIVGTGRMEA